MPWTPRPTRYTPTQRRTILKRQPTCATCNTAPSTIADHIVPLAEGGTNTVDNGQGICHDCHTIKTRAETQRGQARWAARRPRTQRAQRKHPGIID